MIKCDNGEIILSGDAPTLLGEMEYIVLNLKEVLLTSSKGEMLTYLNKDLMLLTQCTNAEEFLELKKKISGGAKGEEENEKI